MCGLVAYEGIRMMDHQHRETFYKHPACTFPQPG